MTRDDLERNALALGFSAVGVCDVDAPTHGKFFEEWLAKGFHGEMEYLAKNAAIRLNPRELLPDAASAIMVALDYNQPNPVQEGKPRIARYALGRDYHRVMRRKLKRLAGVLSSSLPEAQFRACVDSAPLLERELAHLAGLGWFGKNTCLIDSKRGSWFFIGAVLSTHRFPASEPSLGGCGSCTACIDACPTGAIVQEGGRWQVDSRSCISYLTIEKRGEFEEPLHGWTFGCDVCQEVCPFNQPRPSQPARGAAAKEPDLLKTREWPDLERLATISYDEWDRLTQGSAARRAGFEGLRRNARLNVP